MEANARSHHWPHGEFGAGAALLPCMGATRLAAKRSHAGALAILAILGWLGSFGMPDSALGQVREPGADEDLSGQEVNLPSDRATSLNISRARSLIANNRTAEALRLLNAVIESEQDYFLVEPGSTDVAPSAKSAARKMLAELSPEGQESYELQFGEQASKLLAEGAATHNETVLAEVMRRHFHTKAGYRATYVLGHWRLESGQPAAALLCFRRLAETPAAARMFEPLLTVKAAICLLKSGRRNQAEAELRELRETSPDLKITVQGRSRPVFANPQDLVASLSSALGEDLAPAAEAGRDWSDVGAWRVAGGNAARNAPSVGSSPLLTRRWAVRNFTDPSIEEIAQEARAKFNEDGVALAPGLHPIATRDTVFFRSFAGLTAVDFRTGKQIWNGAVDESVQQLIEGIGPYSAQRGSDSAKTSVRKRLWSDAVYGTISTDGQRVFAVEDLKIGLAMGVDLPGRRVVNNRGRIALPSPQSGNRLAAYEIATQGKLAWEFDGQPNGNASEEVFFLGAPLPFEGKLYAIAEIKREVCLLVLNAASGQLEWRQALAAPEANIWSNAIRRAAGASPSIADGVLVCPTAAGALVAIDLADRSLLWAYRYRQRETVDAQMRRQMLFMQGMFPEETIPDSRWCDGSPVLAEGQVLLTPPECDELYCLDLATGEERWRHSRTDDMYVGSAAGGVALVVAQGAVRGYRIENGAQAWPPISLPAGGGPSGKGFYNSGVYYLPMASKEVAAIDVAAGKIVARIKSRNEVVPGNLICYRGAVLSQGIDSLECFFQVDDLGARIAQQLADNPNDARALALRGAIQLEAGQLDEAVDNLQRSYALDATTQTRQILFDALLAGIEADFSRHAAWLAQIEALAPDARERAVYLRIAAAGKARGGDLVGAIEAYAQMADEQATAAVPEAMEQSLKTTRGRWARARIAEILLSATAEQAQAVQAALAPRLAAAQQAGPDSLRQFLGLFGDSSVADRARLALLAADAEQSPLDRERLLRPLAASADPATARAAVAQLAQLLVLANREDAALPYLQSLATQYANEPCLEARTGGQILLELAAGRFSVQRQLGEANWPVGAVELDESGTDLSQSGEAPRPVEVRALEGGQAPPMRVEVRPQARTVVARDELGRQIWQVTLTGPDDGEIFRGLMTGKLTARSSGRLLILSSGIHVAAIDTLGAGLDQPARQLWLLPMTEAPDLDPRMQNFRMRAWQMNRGRRFGRGMPTIEDDRQLGILGPATDDFVCFRRGRKLVAVDARTGATLWERRGMPQDGQVFGDRRTVVVVNAKGEEAILVGGGDGSELRRQRLPTEQSIDAVGTKLLYWSEEEDRLSCYDTLTGQFAWQRPYDEEAVVSLCQDSLVGVLTRRGKFEILDFQTGEPVLAARLDADHSLEEIYLLRTPDAYLLAVNHGRSRDEDEDPAGYAPILGKLYAFDRQTGAQLFNGPTEIYNQLLPLNQPLGLPVLTFAHVDQGGGTLQCVDVRNGRTVYEHDFTEAIEGLEVEGIPAENAVKVRTSKTNAKLRFTNNPLPVNDDGNAQAPTNAGRALRAIIEAFREANDALPEEDGEDEEAADEDEEGEDEQKKEADAEPAQKEVEKEPDGESEEPDSKKSDAERPRGKADEAPRQPNPADNPQFNAVDDD